MDTTHEKLIKDEARFWARAIICSCCPDAPADQERVEFAADAIEDALTKIWGVATAIEAKKHADGKKDEAYTSPYNPFSVGPRVIHQPD